MDTFFASPIKNDDTEIMLQNSEVADHPIITGMLQMASGMLSILNNNRQVIAVNDEMLTSLGFDNMNQLLGLKPGEALDCVQVKNTPSGCGTGPLCSSCGAAMAIVTSLKTNFPVTRKCAIEIEKNEKKTDLFLKIQSVPIQVDNETYLLLFVQDITTEQKWAAMEQVFFHDINNMLTGIVAVSNLLKLEYEGENSDLVDGLSDSVKLITQELATQQYLLNSKDHMYQPIWDTNSIDNIFKHLKSTISTNPIYEEIKFSIEWPKTTINIQSDISLLLRILNNMLLNAFEASMPQEEVKLSCKESGNDIIFEVWNKGVVPKAIADRMFQRNISSKNKTGRGLGTYSMKLFGEEFLGGKVYFKSSLKTGTSFYLSIPKTKTQIASEN